MVLYRSLLSSYDETEFAKAGKVELLEYQLDDRFET